MAEPPLDTLINSVPSLYASVRIFPLSLNSTRKNDILSSVQLPDNIVVSLAKEFGFIQKAIVPVSKPEKGLIWVVKSK